VALQLWRGSLNAHLSIMRGDYGRLRHREIAHFCQAAANGILGIRV
jgi:hypothetical protein